ncbi:MAG: MGMT family protein [Paludibacter sp.]|nr:MGMT family protein [Paludibacter sp.]MDD4198492.1 MGMT family protein [Paludibacter sp.]MDD4427597.1 MGMT family protein [Paludibacter sp.]
MAFTTEGLFSLIFTDSEDTAFADLQRRFPKKVFTEDAQRTNVLGDKIFKLKEPVQLCPQGTPFQQSVWKVLREIPEGETRTYAQVAAAIGNPKAVRAVGTAAGANPIACLIPCHRVIHSDGGLGGYRWGTELKKQMLKTEGAIK